MQQILQVREFPARTLRWWYEEQNNIDLSPSYQRKGGIWQPSQQAFLIDTILNGFDVPKIYLADFTYRNTSLNSSTKPYAVIDGKQRFSAIFDFFDDKFPLAKSFVFLEDINLQLGGLRFSDLLKSHPRVARIFENSGLTVMSVITSDESFINELFVRLNSSKPLTGAEVRGALNGEVPELIKTIASQPFFTNCVSFATKRKQDENLAAKLLLLEFRGKFVDTKKRNLDSLVDEQSQLNASNTGKSKSDELSEQLIFDAFLAESPTLQKATDRVVGILSRMQSIFFDKDQLLKSEGLIPLYYWLARNNNYDSILREFIEYFQNIRLEFKNQQLRNALRQAQVDEERRNLIDLLNKYDVSSRSINDAASLTYMYDVLTSWLDSFVNKRLLNLP